MWAHNPKLTFVHPAANGWFEPTVHLTSDEIMAWTIRGLACIHD